MANFEAISNTLEGIIANQLTASRSTQAAWEWFNALKKIVSSNRFSGTAAVSYGTIDDAADTTIAATVRLFGVLVDNSNAAEPVHVEFADVADADGGDDLLAAFIFVPSSSMRCIVFPEPIVFSTGLSYISGTGTRAGLEGGTAVTGTSPTGIIVYV